MKFPCNEHALSEVIGFVLLLVVIITAFSIYLVYAVPAQGRENEILHMNEIRDQFTSYKIGVDALWTNRQLNSAMSTTFNIGSGGASTQGVFSFVPVMNPVPSSGTLSMNQRNETLIVVSRGLIPDGNTVIKETPVMLPATLSSINATPQGFFVRVSDSTPSDWQSGRRSVLVQGLDWSVNVTVNPKTTYYNYSRGCTLTTCNYYDGLWYAGTDITLNVNKSGMMTLEDYVVYENIQNFPANTVFTIDLLDDAYGMKNYLKELQYPISVTFTKSPSSGSISGYGNISFSDEYDRVASHTLALGALEYSIVNNYWIPQTYYYQNGGVFLKQNDGMSIKLPPTITFSYNTTTRVIGVKIIELPFQQANMGNIGGNSPVQVRTQVTNIQNLSYSLTYNNTRWINMSITSSDSQAASAWISALETSANITSGVPREYYSKSVTGTTGHFNISGSDPSGSTYDIHAEGLRANLSATMQGG